MKNVSSPQNYQVLVHQPQGLLIPRLDGLLSLAKCVAVPILISEDQIIDAIVLAELCGKLISSDGKHARIRLVICGCYLEEQISVSALHMLEVGRDVYLLRDFAVSIQIQHAHILDLRLIQAGAVPTTSRQLFYEWLTSEIDDDTRQKLLKCGRELGLVESTRMPS